MSRHILASVITATLIAGGAATAAADPRAETRSVEIDVSGIDLTTKAGARMVLDRIENAAERVCGVRNGVKSLSETRHERACVDDAIENTINSIGGDPARQAAIRAVREG